MLAGGSGEGSEDFSMEDPVCIDGVIFYGPMTDRERLVKERFERRLKEKAKTQYLPPLTNKEFLGNMTVSSEESKNDISIYESFSIDESKYESFNDSLDDRQFINTNDSNVSKFPSEQITVNRRKFQTKQMLKSSICDSLEDIHSLVSNVEKSISEEIENINIHEKNNIYDDSLRNDICLEKNFISTDQNFDDDSLAILDFEKAFDDSLEEADILSFSHMDNVVILRNGENNNEISVENLTKENAVTKNLFETSVEVIYENAGYIENLEEGNAEPSKQLSLIADSLSMSENLSKDSLDGSPVILKQLEEKSNRKSSDQEKLKKPKTSHEPEYCDNMKVISDLSLNLACDENLSHNVEELVIEEFTDIKTKQDSSNIIIIEDSFVKISDASTLMQRKNSMKRIDSSSLWEKNVSSQINNSFCENDCDKFPSASDIYSSVINNHVNTSDKSINKANCHPNDTICIDDSFNLPQTTASIKDELYFNNRYSEKNKADIHQNDTICIDDSLILPLNTSDKGKFLVSENNEIDEQIHSIKEKDSYIGNPNNVYLNSSTFHVKSEKSTPKEKNVKKSSYSKFHNQNHIKHMQEGLEIENHPNDTICIDDSFILPQNTLINNESYSFDNPRLNNTVDNSFTSSQPMANLKSEKKSPDLKKEKEKDTKGKNSKSNIHSSVKHKSKYLDKNNEVRSPNPNDTIYIDSSPEDPLRMKMDKEDSSGSNNSKKIDKNLYQDKSTSQFLIQSHVKYELQHPKEKNQVQISNLNDTVYIDGSPNNSWRIKEDKRTSSYKDSKVQFPELKNDNVFNQKQFTSHQFAHIPNSPLEKCTNSNILKDPKIAIDYLKEALVFPKDLPKDSNLKLQLEVEFDKNQGVNIISVSAVDQHTKNITPIKVDSKEVLANHSPDKRDKNKSNIALQFSDKICENSVITNKIITQEYSVDLPESKPSSIQGYQRKDKTDINFSNNTQSDVVQHNIQLLEALDLHDTSCSFVDKGFLESRDSIMPLNLCIRSKSPKTNYQCLMKAESKENIPAYGKELDTSNQSRSKRKSSTKESNKTPKQLNCNTDIKKSGSKLNSTTKIPVRKIDNPLFTPVHQKLTRDIKCNSSSEKIIKNPLVKSISATDNLAFEKPQETPRKHHFCTVRNSISKVPKSTPRSIPKRFQNIESPIAKYIGKSQMYTPLKITHRYDGNLILGNTVQSSKQLMKTPNNFRKGSPQCSSAGKM